MSRARPHNAWPPKVSRTASDTTGQPIHETFASFDERPLASASIGQVHRARLYVSEPASVPSPAPELRPTVDVAVKVQRPNIRATIERDVDLLYLLARTVERAVPESTIYAPTRLVAAKRAGVWPGKPNIRSSERRRKPWARARAKALAGRSDAAW